MPQSYIDAFRFKGTVKLIRNPVIFQMLLLGAVFMRNADLVYAPGPHVLRDSPAGVAKTMLMIINVLLVRMSGGSVRTAGRALRGTGAVARKLEGFLISLSKHYVVRDSVSSAVVGRELRFAPDLALGRPTYTSRLHRKLVSCSFRSDTAVNLQTFKKIIEEAKDLGLEVVLVSQVQRDDAQHQALATAFGVTAFLWESKTHSEQQSIVDSLYSQSYVVISNRLHGLIFGINCGALPVEYRIGSSDKIQSTLLSGFGSYSVIFDETPISGHSRLLPSEELEHLASALEASAKEARIAVTGLLEALLENAPLASPKTSPAQG